VIELTNKHVPLRLIPSYLHLIFQLQNKTSIQRVSILTEVILENSSDLDRLQLVYRAIVRLRELNTKEAEDAMLSLISDVRGAHVTRALLLSLNLTVTSNKRNLLLNILNGTDYSDKYLCAIYVVCSMYKNGEFNQEDQAIFENILVREVEGAGACTDSTHAILTALKRVNPQAIGRIKDFDSLIDRIFGYDRNTAEAFKAHDF